MNYWWETDGTSRSSPTRRVDERVRAASAARRTVVKAFNHMGYHDLEDLAGRVAHRAPRSRSPAPPRQAGIVAELVEELGFDPVVIGPLAEGVRLQPFAEAFGAGGDAARCGRSWTASLRPSRGAR